MKNKNQNINHIAIIIGNKKLIKEVCERSVTLLKKLQVTSANELEQAQKETNDLYKILYKYKPKKNDSGYVRDLYSRLIMEMNQMAKSREKLELFGDNYLVGQTKWIFLLSTLMFTVFILAASFLTGQIFQSIIGMVLIIIVTFVIYLLFDLDDISYGGNAIKTENIKATMKNIQKEMKKATK